MGSNNDGKLNNRQLRVLLTYRHSRADGRGTFTKLVVIGFVIDI